MRLAKKGDVGVPASREVATFRSVVGEFYQRRRAECTVLLGLIVIPQRYL